MRLTSQSQMSLHRGLAAQVCRGQMRLTGQSQMSLLSIVEQIILTGQSHLSLGQSQLSPFHGQIKGTFEIDK